MAPQPATSSPSGHPEAERLVPLQVLMEGEREIRNLIEKHAYELFEHRGCGHYSELSDRLKAESKLFSSCCRELKNLPDTLVLKVEMPGNFTAAETVLNVESCRFMVWKARKVETIYADQKGTYFQTIHQRVFREHELPDEVAPSRTFATLRSNIRKVAMRTMTHRSGFEQFS